MSQLEEYEEYEERIVAVYQEVKTPFLDRGAAAVKVTAGDGRHAALIEITPALGTASPLTIHLDAPGDLDLYVGRHGLTTHIWEAKEWKRGNPRPLEAKLQDWLRAITAGSYAEEVRLAADGAIGKGRGTVGLADGSHTFTYSYLPTLGERGPWQRISYSAY